MTCSLCPNPAVPLYPDVTARPLCEQCRASEAAKYRSPEELAVTIALAGEVTTEQLLQLVRDERDALYRALETTECERDAYARVYGIAASLRTFPVPMEQHFQLMDAVDAARAELESKENGSTFTNVDAEERKLPCADRAATVLSDLLRVFKRELSGGYSTAEQQQVLREARELVR